MYHNFIEQTHFIGILMPPDIAGPLEDCRRWMAEQYGCRSGLKTPIHVTIVPPFHMDAGADCEPIAEALARSLSACRTAGRIPFKALIKGFSSFGGRTLFARVVPGPEWTSMRDAVYDELLGPLSSAGQKLKRDGRPFVPHLTIANRDIPDGACGAALAHFAPLRLEKEATINSITLFERQAGRWIVSSTLN